MDMRSCFRDAVVLSFLLFTSSVKAEIETIRIASPNRGSWEGAIPEIGKQAGIFKKHGLNPEILYTSGGGETLQVVISGAVDIGLSAGMAGVFSAFSKGAPIRVIGASSTGSKEVFYYVPAQSPLQSLKDLHGKTISYSTTGSSTHVGALKVIEEYALKGSRVVATGDAISTTTQTLTGQVDVGWSNGPFNLDRLASGEIRMIGRLSDIAHMRGQTIRVQIGNAQAIAAKNDLFKRYLKAYQETLDWMYISPEALKIYMGIVSFPEQSVKRTISEFITKDTLQISLVMGVPEAMADAIQFKFINSTLAENQLAELIIINSLK